MERRKGKNHRCSICLRHGKLHALSWTMFLGDAITASWQPSLRFDTDYSRLCWMKAFASCSLYGSFEIMSALVDRQNGMSGLHRAPRACPKQYFPSLPCVGMGRPQEQSTQSTTPHAKNETATCIYIYMCVIFQGCQTHTDGI